MGEDKQCKPHTTNMEKNTEKEEVRSSEELKK